MNGLEDAVKEFVQDKSPEIPPTLEEEKTDNKIIEAEKDNENEDHYENNVSPSEEVYDLDKFNQEHPERSSPKEEYAKTTVNEFTGFTDKEGIVVKVSSPEKKEGGIFSKSYVSYLVKTEPFDFKTRKRYSDFLWLRNTLSLVYSLCAIPPLCKKIMLTDLVEFYLIKE